MIEIGDILVTRLAEVVKITEYPQYDLTYYCVKFWEPWSKDWYLAYYEKKALEEMLGKITVKEMR